MVIAEKAVEHMQVDSGFRDDQSPVWLYDPFCFTPWYTAELALALKESGLNLRLLCGSLVREPKYFQHRSLAPEVRLSFLSRVPNLGLRPISRLLRFTQSISTIRMLVSDLKSVSSPRPKVLHLQQLPLLDRGIESDFALIAAAQHLRVPVIHTVHNILPHSAGEQARSRYDKLYRQVDHLICHSIYAAERLTSEFGIDQSRISVIPHGPLFTVEAPSPQEDKMAARQRLGIPLDRPIVLWQGILAEYKGLDMLLEAWRLYIDSNSSVASVRPLLLIAGTGPRNIELITREQVRKMPSSVRADLRYIASGELPDFYSAADILVYPYRAITTSGALLTGLSYRKPIIASDLPPFGDYLISGQNAILVEPRNVDAWGLALQSILADFTPSQHGEPKNRALNTFEQLSDGAKLNRTRYVGWESIAALTAALYSRLAN